MGATTLVDTVAYASDASVRIVMHSALVKTGTTNTSTFQKTYVKLPPLASPWLQVPAGILNRNFFDPNFFPSVSTASGVIPQGIDPSAINGVAWAAPYGSAGTGLPLSCVIDGITFAYVRGGGTIAEGDVLFAGDQYGRVDNAANLGIAGGVHAHMLGYAEAPAAATANLIIPIRVQLTEVVL